MSYRRIFFWALAFIIMFAVGVIVSTKAPKAPKPLPTFSGFKTIGTDVAKRPSTPTPPPTATPTPQQITYYTVKEGDTLESISLRFGVSWIDLANLNKIANPNYIEVGQILQISHDPADYKDIDPYYFDEIYKAEDGEKHILVVLSEQKLYTYEGDKLLTSYTISSGVAQYPTVTGIYKIQTKLTSTTMSGQGYNYPDVKNTMYFYGDYGIHGTYWHNNFGTPMSHGCVNMSEPDSKEVFNWAEVGTIVQVIP